MSLEIETARALAGDAISLRLCELLEPSRPLITARQARAATPNFTWVSCHDFHSPLGWWRAEIGTEHGPETADDDLVEWLPFLSCEWDEIDRAWLVVEEIKSRGWLPHILAMVDGWVVNARRYVLVDGKWDGRAKSTGDMVQEAGDTLVETIYRSAIIALIQTPCGIPLEIRKGRT